mmetsp:Transcript_23770/g.53929  ORF Transcript_23770/g.53929 Transcript_23770/m.53929 type:complete len:404 (-) Transcript_23770:808-2019(-)
MGAAVSELSCTRCHDVKPEAEFFTRPACRPCTVVLPEDGPQDPVARLQVRMTKRFRRQGAALTTISAATPECLTWKPHTLAFGFCRRILGIESAGPEIDQPDRVTLGKTLGSGTFGSVLIGHHANAKLGDVAVKRFGLCRLPDKQGSKIRTSYENERDVLSELHHPFIVHVFDAYVDEEAAYLILELCRGGDLYDFVVKSHSRQTGTKRGVTEEMAQVMLRQMVLAVHYLHGRHIVHRDIKSENFVFLKPPFQESVNDWVLKLCDFGAATRLSDSAPRCMANIGTLSYTAPEVYDQRGASFVADVWSVGVVLYVVLCGYSPFRPCGTETPEQAVGRIRQGDFETGRPSWLRLSATAQNLICCMLVVDEERRLSARAVLSHPFLGLSQQLFLQISPFCQRKLGN